MTAAPPDERPQARNILLVSAVIALFVFLSHAAFLNLPFYWDELGQFVPASLDLFQSGSWIPHSTVANVHPPGVMAYLAGVRSEERRVGKECRWWGRGEEGKSSV